MRVLTKRAMMAVATIVAVMATLVALPGVAQAQESGDVTIAGRGWLHAAGTGQADLDMGGHLRLHVDGDVTITDNAGDMRVRLRGVSDVAEEERSTNVSLTDFRGFVNVRGTNYSVHIDGKLVLNAHGRGQANLVGDGWYRTRHGGRTVWDGVVQIGDPQLEPAA